jgi:hypothetical protein
LAKELLEHNDDRIIQGHLSAATFTIGTVVGSFIPFWQARAKAYETWLNDANTGVKPKLFARRMIEGLQRSIETEELREADDDG